jgi:AraC family transcriptional regulator
MLGAVDQAATDRVNPSRARAKTKVWGSANQYDIRINHRRMEQLVLVDLCCHSVGQSQGRPVECELIDLCKPINEKVKAMLTDSLPTNAASSCEMNSSRLSQAIVPPSIERRAGPRHADRDPARRPCHRAVTGTVVEISPPDSVKRRTAAWPGMAAEIVQATRHDRIESCFCAPVHLLAAYEHGQRHDGETFIEGLPKSTLRDFRRKLVFVPAGHSYHDWQEPRTLTRVVYFYFDPAGLAVSPEFRFANMSFAPRLFFEDNALWDTALKLTKVIESAGTEHRLYVEALGVVLAHELARFNAGRPCVEPPVRGGLAAWQQRTIVGYVEDHLAEPMSLPTLAQLVRLSPCHFCRAFKQSFGITPGRYLTSRRIERAKTLLAKPAPSVTEIGLAVGFSETSSFTATFRKATGLTPTAYHRSLS